MIQFTKNGQGFWDFDFEALAELTTLEFSNEIKDVVKGRSFNILKDVVFNETEHCYEIRLYMYSYIHVFEFYKDGKFVHDYQVFYLDMQKYLSHAQKVGCCVD